MMTHIPTPRRTSHQKVQGEFYPLQKEELIALRKAKLINNAAYVHLALRFENPYCDRLYSDSEGLIIEAACMIFGVKVTAEEV